MDNWQYRPARDADLPPLQRFRSARRELGLVSCVAGSLRWGLVRSYLRLMHNWKVEGREHLPAGPPFILVANHSSHLDALSLCAALPLRLNVRTFPVAAGDTFFQSTATATFAALFLNALPMARDGSGGGSLLALRERLIGEPCGLVLFPEGTRSRTGELARFKSGIGMLVAGTHVPVIPAWLKGAHTAWPPDCRIPRRAPISLRIGAPLAFETTPNDRAGWKSIADTLEHAVRTLGDAKTAR